MTVEPRSRKPMSQDIWRNTPTRYVESTTVLGNPLNCKTWLDVDYDKGLTSEWHWEIMIQTTFVLLQCKTFLRCNLLHKWNNIYIDHRCQFASGTSNAGALNPPDAPFQCYLNHEQQNDLCCRAQLQTPSEHMQYCCKISSTDTRTFAWPIICLCASIPPDHTHLEAFRKEYVPRNVFFHPS